MPARFSPFIVPADSDYGEFLGGYFTKEKRDERREARKARRAARRKARRTGKSIPRLTLKSPAKKLWASKYPWVERPSTAGWEVAFMTVGAGAYEKLSEPIAKGGRPTGAFQDREFRCTVLGGLQALQAAGVSGYDTLDLSRVKVPPVATDKYDKQLMLLAGGAASLKDAAEFIRKVVIQNGLETTAWFYRAILMIQPAVVSGEVRSMVGGIVAVVAPPISSIVGGVISAGEAVHTAEIEASLSKFSQKAEQGLSKYGVRLAKQRAQQQLAIAQQVSAEEAKLACYEAEENVRSKAGAIRLACYGVLGLALLGGTYYIFSKRLGNE